ncbi:MAG: hypothetical protein ACPGWR_22480 [Ardenticatenaceae bacterium]
MDNTQVELAALIARAWLDDEFKELLESNPEAAFNEYSLKHEDYVDLKIPKNPIDIKNSATLFDETTCETTSATCTYSVIIRFKKGEMYVVAKGATIGTHGECFKHKINPENKLVEISRDFNGEDKLTYSAYDLSKINNK